MTCRQRQFDWNGFAWACTKVAASSITELPEFYHGLTNEIDLEAKIDVTKYTYWILIAKEIEYIYFPAILKVYFLAERWDWVGSQHCLWEISFAISNCCNNEKMIFTQSYLSTNGGSNNLTRGWVRRKLSHTLIGKIWERGCLFISEIRFGIVYLVTFN